jgi:HAD superfamily hydrolase (TIGR01549 family)
VSQPPPAPPTTGELDDTVDGLEQTYGRELGDLEAAGRLPEPDGPAPTVVAFDIGEVLIDETRVWSCWADVLGVSHLTFAAVLGAAIAQGSDYPEVFTHVAPNVDWEAFTDEHERRYEGFLPGDLYADAMLCLSELRELGFRVVIAGNQPIQRREQLLSLGLPADAIVTSDQLGVSKPDTAFFAEVLKLADTTDPSDVLYVGDRVDNDVLPALSYGMHACWLRRGPYGALQELPDGVEPDLVLDGLGELPLLMEHWRSS